MPVFHFACICSKCQWSLHAWHSCSLIYFTSPKISRTIMKESDSSLGKVWIVDNTVLHIHLFFFFTTCSAFCLTIFVNTWYIINIYYINSLYRLLSWQHWWPEITFFFSTVQVIHAKIMNMSCFADACLGKRDLQPIYGLLHFSLAPTDNDLGLRLWLCQRTAVVISAVVAQALWMFLGYLALLWLRLEMKMWKSKQPSFRCESCADLAFNSWEGTKTCLQKLLYRCLLLI